MMMNKPANWDSVEAITGEYKKLPADEVEASQAGFFNQEAVDALWAFEQEARKYLDGKRNQISLFGEDTEAETVTDDVSVVDISAPNNVVQMPTVAQ